MRLKGLVAPLSFAILIAGAAPLFAQSLADLAKKEEERRKKLPEPAKVYTNKDLSAPPPSSTPPPPAAPSAQAATPDASKDAAKEKPASSEPAKDQAYWAGRMKALRAQLDRDESYSIALESRLNALNTDFVNRDDPAQRSVIERDRQKAMAEFNRLKQAIIDGKKAIADLEEEARRAGVPPGWLR